MDLNRVKVYRKGLNVERLHTITHLTPYSNGSHSANAALLADELCAENKLYSSSAACMRYMLLHDIAEGYIGDIPAYVKRENPEVAKALQVAEKNWEKRHLPNMPGLSRTEQEICKVSDLAELGMYCIDELNLGNNNMLPVLEKVVRYMQDYHHIKGCDQLIKYFTTRGIL